MLIRTKLDGAHMVAIIDEMDRTQSPDHRLHLDAIVRAYKEGLLYGIVETDYHAQNPAIYAHYARRDGKVEYFSDDFLMPAYCIYTDASLHRVRYIWVAPRARRIGLASILMQGVTEVIGVLDQAIAFYEALGFKAMNVYGTYRYVGKVKDLK